MGSSTAIACDGSTEQPREDDVVNRPPPQTPHVLAEDLAVVLPAGARVLELACGNGRNTRFLRQKHFIVDAIPDADAASFCTNDERAGAYDAVLSTHGLLHGNRSDIARIVARIAACLKPNAPLFAAFGSTADARFGTGAQLGPKTFAPLDGDEAGVAHTYFTEMELRELLSPFFRMESLRERGGWHAEGSVHWHVRALRA